MPNPQSPQSLWQRALVARVGIAVSTSDRVLLRQQLYRFRADAGDARLDDFVLVFPKEDSELWIVRKGADAPAG
jgi:hypothetical protein